MADTASSSSDEEEYITYKLKIHDADISDAGKWLCEVKDKYGSVSTACDVNVYEEAKRQSITSAKDIKIIQNGISANGINSEEGENLTYSLKIQDANSENAVSQLDPIPEAPKFLMTLRDIVTLEGQSLKLICRVRGTPLPNIVWYINGEPISKDDYSYQVLYLSDGTISLEVYHPKPESESAVFKCEAQNEEGVVSTHCTVEVIAKKRGESLSRDHLLNFSKYSRARSETRANSESRMSARATSESRYAGSSSLSTSSKRITDYYINGKSTWRNYHADLDSGIYDIYNPGYTPLKFLHAEETEPELKLKMRFSQDEEFYFSENLKHKCVLEGSRLYLSAFVIGKLPIFGQWYKDGKPLLNNVYERYVIRSRAGHLSLEVPLTDVEDTGNYLLDVRNEQGRMNSACYVQIEPRFKNRMQFEKPTFLERIRHIHVNEGETATFQVVAKGNPQPGITWFKDGKRIQMSHRVTIHTGEKGSSILVIHDCDFSDMGLYKVEAHNYAGRCIGSAKLTVFEIGTRFCCSEEGEYKILKRRNTVNEEESGKDVTLSSVRTRFSHTDRSSRLDKYSVDREMSYSSTSERKSNVTGLDELDIYSKRSRTGRKIMNGELESYEIVSKVTSSGLEASNVASERSLSQKSTESVKTDIQQGQSSDIQIKSSGDLLTDSGSKKFESATESLKVKSEVQSSAIVTESKDLSSTAVKTLEMSDNSLEKFTVASEASQKSESGILDQIVGISAGIKQTTEVASVGSSKVIGETEETTSRREKLRKQVSEEALVESALNGRSWVMFDNMDVKNEKKLKSQSTRNGKIANGERISDNEKVPGQVRKANLTFGRPEVMVSENNSSQRDVSKMKSDITAEKMIAGLLLKGTDQTESAIAENKFKVEDTEKATVKAEEAEKAKIAAEKVEKAKIAAEEAEKAKIKAEEAEKARIAAVEAEKVRIAAEDAEKAKIAAEEAEKARISDKEAEKAKIAAEEAENTRIAAEEAEKSRIAAEEAEKANSSKPKKKRRLTFEEAEKQRLEAESAEATNKESEIAAEKTKKETKTSEEAEKAKMKGVEEENARIAAEEAEKARIAAEEAEKSRIAVEEAEKSRIAAEEAEKARIAAEEGEKAKIKAEEAEKARIATVEAEKANIKAEEEEKARIAAEEAEKAKIKAEQEEKARIATEEAEKARIAAEEEKVKFAAEEAEKARIAAEEADKAKIKAEKAKIKAEEAEKARIATAEAEKAKIKAEEEEKAKIATEEAKKTKIKAEQEEKARIATEEAEKARIAAEEEKTKLAAEETEKEKIKAAEAEIARIAAEQAEKARIAEAEKAKIAVELETKTKSTEVKESVNEAVSSQLEAKTESSEVISVSKSNITETKTEEIEVREVLSQKSEQKISKDTEITEKSLIRSDNTMGTGTEAEIVTEEDNVVEEKETIYTTPPNIVKYLPKLVEIKDGEKLNLECLVSGEPKPKVIWLHNSKKITSEMTHISITSKAEYHNLEILEADFIRDSGTYTIRTSNISGEKESHCEVNIDGSLKKIKVEEEKKDSKQEIQTVMEVGEKKDVKIEAEIVLEAEEKKSSYMEAEMLVSYEEKKDSIKKTEMLTSEEKTIVEVDGSRIENKVDTSETDIKVIERKEGVSAKKVVSVEEEISVKTETSQTESSSILTKSKIETESVTEPMEVTEVSTSQITTTCLESAPSSLKKEKKEMTGKAYFEVPLHEEYHAMERDEDVRLYVKVGGEPYSPAKWYKDGEELEQTRRILINWDMETQESTVVIRRFKVIDVGVYECVVLGDKGPFSSKTTVHLIRLESQRIESNVPLDASEVSDVPVILYPIRDTRVYKGQEAYFECAVDKNRKVTVKWFKDGTDITNRKRKFYFKENKGVYSLTVDDVQDEDCGSYTFEVTCEDGVFSISANIILEVEKNKSIEIGPPKVITQPDSIVSVPVDGVIVLKCCAVANPPAKFQWQKDMVDIMQCPRVVVAFPNPGESTLTISGVTYSDRGMYVCVVKNRLGRVKTRCNLHVGVDILLKDKAKVKSDNLDLDQSPTEEDKEVIMKLDGDTNAIEETEKARIQVEETMKVKIASEEADKARIAEETEEDRIALEKAEKARIAAEEAEKARIAADEEEKVRISAEEAEKTRLVAEEKEKAKTAAEEVEKAKIAAEEVEKAKIAAEEAEKAKTESLKPKKKYRLTFEEAEKQRLEAESSEAVVSKDAEIAAENAEQETIAEDSEKARIATEEAEKIRLAAEEAEKARIATEEAEKARIATEEAEKARIATEEAEKARIATEEAKKVQIIEEEAKKARVATEEVEKARIAAEEAEQAETASSKPKKKHRLTFEEAEEQRLEAESVETADKEAKDDVEQTEKEAEKARLAAEAEKARIATEEGEKARIAAEEVKKARIAAEEAEKAKTAAEEAEKARIAAEEAEKARISTEEAEKARLAAEEAEKARISAEEVEKARLAIEEAEKARIATEEAEKARIAAEEVKKARIAAEEAEKAKTAAEEAEKARIAAEEAEKARISTEEAEKARLAAEEAEKARISAEEVEKARLAIEEAEKARIATEEAEKARIAAEEAKKAEIAAEAEKARIAAEKAEKARIAAEEVEKARIAAEEAEKARIAAEEAEKARIAVEEAEKARIAAEEAEKARIAAEEAEKARLASEAEKSRIAAEEAEKARLATEEAVEARIATEEAEKARIAAEEAKKAEIAAELEKARIAEEAENARIAEEEAEKVRIAAEEAEKAKNLEETKPKKKRRLTFEEAEKQRLEAEAAESKEVQLSTEEAEKARISEEAEKAKIAAEEAEKARIAAEEGKKARIAAVEAEKARIAAEETERAKIAAEKEERIKIAQEATIDSKSTSKSTKKHRLTFEEAEKLRLETEKAEKLNSELSEQTLTVESLNTVSIPDSDTSLHSSIEGSLSENSSSIVKANVEGKVAIKKQKTERRFSEIEEVDGGVVSKMSEFSVKKVVSGNEVVTETPEKGQISIISQDSVCQIDSTQQDVASQTRHQLKKRLSADGSSYEILEVSTQRVTKTIGEVSTAPLAVTHHHVHHPPELIRRPDSKHVPTHSELELTVRVRASKHAKVSWVHDGEPISFKGQKHYELITEEEPLKE